MSKTLKYQVSSTTLSVYENFKVPYKKKVK